MVQCWQKSVREYAMKCEILYQTKIDYETESSIRTETVFTGIISWDGESDLGKLISAKEQAFFEYRDPRVASSRGNYRNPRIEVTGLRFGGQDGLMFVPAGAILLIAHIEPMTV